MISVFKHNDNIILHNTISFISNIVSAVQ